MIVLYVLTLGASAGLAGLAGRHLVAMTGLVPTLDAALVLTAGIACLYAAVQCLFMLALRLLKPTPSSGPMFSEILSHACAVLLIPFLQKMMPPLPGEFADSDIVQKIAPLVFVGLFVAAHLFFKLLSWFWAMQAPPGNRLWATGWIAAAAASLIGAGYFLNDWRTMLAQARPTVDATQEIYAAAGVHTKAKAFPEEAIFSFSLENRQDRNLVLRWANVPEAPFPLTTLYITLHISPGEQTISETLTLEENGWTTLRIPAEGIPEGAARCTVSWAASQEPSWISQLGLWPVMAGSETILLSGPFFHAAGAKEETPNLLVLMVDGLSARHVSGFGYERETTPRLDAFSRDAHTYSHIFTPALEAMAPTLSLLTGLTPLRHGFLGAHRGPQPEEVRTLTELLHEQGYVTAAFTEGEAPAAADLTYGSGIERGFELFDDSYSLQSPQRRSNTPAAPIPVGSHLTLNKAGDWIEAHRGDRFFLLVRLREMAEVDYSPRYGQGFVQSVRYPRPIEVYDTAIRYVDEQIGLFLERVDRLGLLANTAIVITSPYGQDLTGGWNATAKVQLSEPSLRVPVYLRIPGRAGGTHDRLGSIEDVGAAIAGIMGVSFPHAPTGSNVLTSITSTEPISMDGDPLHMSLRTQRWRFLWNSGRPAFSLASVSAPEPIEMLDIAYYLKNLRQENNLRRQTSLVDLYTNRLEAFLRENTGQYLEATATGPAGQTPEVLAPASDLTSPPPADPPNP